jgi:CBS domain containing-hemolysin-like protein
MTWHQLLFRLCAIFLLIFINAFFVMGEFAIVSVRRSRIDHLVIGGDIPAQTVQSLQKSLDSGLDCYIRDYTQGSAANLRRPIY